MRIASYAYLINMVNLKMQADHEGRRKSLTVTFLRYLLLLEVVPFSKGSLNELLKFSFHGAQFFVCVEIECLWQKISNVVAEIIFAVHVEVTVFLVLAEPVIAVPCRGCDQLPPLRGEILHLVCSRDEKWGVRV